MIEITGATRIIEGRSIPAPCRLTIEKGRHLLLLGPSGCGKTTLLNLASGLARADSGDIAFHGHSYAALPDSGRDSLRARHFGFIFQKLHLIGHLTVAQNIALAQPHGAPDRISALLHELDMTEKAGQKARDLSLGEAQRVAIARAAVNNPEVIFADEPTSALDDVQAARVMHMLMAQAEKTGATLVAATHDARIKACFPHIHEMTA